MSSSEKQDRIRKISNTERTFYSCVDKLYRIIKESGISRWDKLDSLLDLADLMEKYYIYRSNQQNSSFHTDDSVLNLRMLAIIAGAQILYYNILNRNFHEVLSSLSDSGGSPDRIKAIVLILENKKNFRGTILGSDVFITGHLPDEYSERVLEVIRDLEGLDTSEIILSDIISQVYQKFLPDAVRRLQGIYFTRTKASAFLNELVIDAAGKTIFDPSSGTGMLLVYSFQRLKELGVKNPVKLVSGNDINGLATELAKFNLLTLDQAVSLDDITMYNHDTVGFIWGNIKEGNDTRDSSGEDGNGTKLRKKFDIIIGNPPFTKGTRLSKTMKKNIRKHLLDKHGITESFGRLNLYGIFLLLALDITRERGIIAYILPQGAINTLSMEKIWNTVFSRGFGMKYLIGASSADEAFSDSGDQEIIIILEREFREKCRIVKLKGRLHDKKIKLLVQQVKTGKTGEYGSFTLREEEQDYFTGQPCINWSISVNPFLMKLYRDFIPLDKNEYSSRAFTRDLSSFISIVPRNTSIPADYWNIPNKYWTVSRKDSEFIYILPSEENLLIDKDLKGNEITIPLSVLKISMSRSLREYSDFPAIVPSLENIPSIKREKLSVYFLMDDSSPCLSAYREWGKKARDAGVLGKGNINSLPGLNQGGILAKIDLLVSKVLALRFTDSMVGTGSLICGYHSQQTKNSDLFFAYLSSSLFLLDVVDKCRIRRAEFVRIHKVDLFRKYLFPDFNKMDESTEIAGKILDASRKLHSTTSLKNRPKFAELVDLAMNDSSHPLRKLDEAWLEFTGCKPGDIDEIYSRLRSFFDELILKRN